MPQYNDQADITIRFQPFQLYPQLKRLDDEGVDKGSFFNGIVEMNHGKDAVKNKGRKQFLKDAWAKEGLDLSMDDQCEMHGHFGNSFDAQRLILFARKQGHENQMIEEIYTANHVNNLCLSNLSVLLAAAERAGVAGAENMLKSAEGEAEVKATIKKYREMGLSSVPCLIINDEHVINGCPEEEFLSEVFSKVLGDKSSI